MSTGIEDLLGYEDEPAAAGRRRSAARWFRTALVIGAGTAVVIAGLRVVGLAVSPYVVLAGVLALSLVRRAVAGVAPPPPPPGGYVTMTDPEPTGRDGLDRAIGRWARLLDWASGDADRYATVRARLAALADERLRQRHGITSDGDPDRARALLGDRLWAALHQPTRRAPSSRDLATIVAELEKI